MYTSYLAFGEGKSGTTALYSSIDESVPEPKSNFFEPESLLPCLEKIGTTNVVGKVLIEQLKAGEVDHILHFDKSIMIIRDPRDTLVSRLLYRVRDMQFIYHPERVAKFIGALREKEADSSSWSTIGLYGLLAEISEEKDPLPFFARLHTKTVNLAKRLGSQIHALHYEGFIAGKTAAVDEFLGFSVSSQVEVAATYRRVARTKGTGDWKNWFTEEDIDYCRDMYGTYLDHFGYDTWTRNGDPKVNPETGSEYVERIIRMKRNRTG